MRRLTLLAAAIAASVLGFAPAAHAANQICYDLTVDVNGPVISEADCIEL